MLYKKDIISNMYLLVDLLKVPISDCILGAGGSLVMHGLRDCTFDLDISIPEIIFDKLDGYQTKAIDSTGSILLKYSDVFDLHKGNSYSTLVIDGITCTTLQEVLKLKTILNREKDQEDILKINNYLNSLCS